jgi:hypothetical protein
MLAAGLSSSVRVGFVVDKVAGGLVFLEYFGFSLPLLFHQCVIHFNSFIAGAIYS